MEVQYLREMRQNYMMITVEDMQDQGYEARMMIGNTIEGLLKFRIKRTDSRSQFCYEITSKQPLSRLLEQSTINAVQIRRLLLGIARTLTRMEDYLLTEEQILLDPDYIYMNPDDYQPFLCLIPGKTGDFPHEFSLFLQFLLGKVDHQDREAVVLTYGLYRESLKENYGLDNLLRWLMKENCPNVESTGISRECETMKQEKIESGEANRFDRPDSPPAGPPEKRPWYWYMTPAAIVTALTAGIVLFFGVSVLWKYGVWMMLADILVLAAGIFLCVRDNHGLPEITLFHRLSSQNHTSSTHTFYNHTSYNQTSCSSELSGQPLSRETAANPRTPPQNIQPGQWQSIFEEFREEKSQEIDVSIAADTEDKKTVLLWDQEETKTVRGLVSEDGSGQIPIPYYPFIIGRREGICDYVLSRNTVSFLHVRIDETEGGYCITDLNSDNGTYVNGQCLNANETVSVAPGDEITIADLKFRLK